MPRTTIDLDASVLRELKKRQRQNGQSLGRLVSELLTEALSQDRSQSESPAAFSWATGPMRARVDLEDKEAVRRALDEEA